MPTKLKILFFTGAGISAESGLQTFRDSKDGLWNNFEIEDVCTPHGWKRNRGLVLEFYNQRRRQLKEVSPNTAHELIASLEDKFDVTVVTQNVDDLHERAGSSKIIHLHGELLKVRSTVDEQLVYDWHEDLKLGDLCVKNSQLRPHIVWFGESLDDKKIHLATKAAMECNLCVIIGSSLQVFPANQIPTYVHEKSKIVVIDPNDIQMDFENLKQREIHHLKSSAVEGMTELYEIVREL